MTIAQRYGLPIEGGTIFTEPAASRIVLELGLIDKLKVTQQGLSTKKATFQGIVDATVDDYYVAALRFHGFEKEEDNGFAAIVMSKAHFTCVDVIAKVRELAVQMDASLAAWYPVIIEPSNN